VSSFILLDTPEVTDEPASLRHIPVLGREAVELLARRRHLRRCDLRRLQPSHFDTAGTRVVGTIGIGRQRRARLVDRRPDG
jgi:hypothetical protein